VGGTTKNGTGICSANIEFGSLWESEGNLAELVGYVRTSSTSGQKQLQAATKKTRNQMLFDYGGDPTLSHELSKHKKKRFQRNGDATVQIEKNCP